jgi:hypothetical protein
MWRRFWSGRFEARRLATEGTGEYAEGRGTLPSGESV